MGLLRSRLPARGDREPVSVQDRARALRGAARGDEAARRADAAYVRDRAGRVERALSAPGARGEPVLVPDAARADPDGAVAADARVPDPLRAAGLPPRPHEQATVAVAVLL